MTASSLLGALALFGSRLGDSFFEHLLANGGRTLVLLLRIAQQLPELLLLFLIELVGFGAKEFSLQLGDDRLGFGQLLRLLLKFLLPLGCLLTQLPELFLQLESIIGQSRQIIGKFAQQFFGRLHPWASLGIGVTS